MQSPRATAAFDAGERSTMSRTIRIWATATAISLACFAAQSQAENLLLKRGDGSTITSIPLMTSNGCTVVGGGDIEVRPQPAEGTQGDGWCPEVIGVALPQFTVPLSVSPSTVALGTPVAATWTATSGTAMTCTGTATLDSTGTTVAGWSGPRDASQAAPGLSINLPSAGTYALMVTCTNSAGSTTSTSQTVTVILSGGCPGGFPPSFGLTRQLTMTNPCPPSGCVLQGNTEHPNGSLAVTQYSVIAGPWPARTGNGTIAIQPNKFVALEFNTGTVTQATYGGTISNPNRFGTLETSQASQNNGQVLLAFSECPGDFEHLPYNNNLCRFSGGQGMWPFVVGMADPFACRLDENKTYYLNAAYIDFNSQQSSCSNPESMTGSNPNSCHWFVQPR
jgi:hypothetical protein